jgi:O-acetyl-ADP-ribose deacetylase (regulator of RNase III)
MAGLVTLADIPTISRLYKAGSLAPHTSVVDTYPSQALNNIFSLARGDITKLQVDCIVNAANESLLGGGGVDGAIHRAAGPDLHRECRALNGCETGDAKITGAYDLPCQKIIHTVGPIYDTAEKSEPLLRRCYRRSLRLAVRNGIRTIAFPAVSTGVYHYPSIEAAEAVILEVKQFLLRSENVGKLDRVIFCNFLPKDVDAYESLIP